MVELVVPSDAGIGVPFHGIRTHSQKMTISTQMTRAPVPSEIIKRFKSVGFFDETSVDFSPRKSDANAMIAISFQVRMELVQGDELVVELKRFCACIIILQLVL